MINFTLKTEVFNFKYLPDFADFILKNKLEEFVTVGIRFCREADLPILKPLSKFSEPELVKLSMETNRQMLEAISGNKIAEHISAGAKRWIANDLGILDKDDVLAEDLTLGFYLRRKIFSYFLDAYTKNVVMQKFIISELDVFTTQEELVSYSIYLKMQQEKLAVHKDLLQVTEELAGIGSYVVDLADRRRSIYTTQYLKIIECAEPPAFEDIADYIHPDDRQEVKRRVDAAMKNGGQMELEYRYRKGLNEKRIWSVGIVELLEGKPAFIRGSIRDITQMHDVLQQLKDTERLYKLGQELNHFGNWSWDLATGRLLWSDEMYNIFGIENGRSMTLGEFLAFVHPDDKEKIKEELENLTPSGPGSGYIYRITTPAGVHKVLRGVNKVDTNDQKLIIRCHGTCQDITQIFRVGPQ